MRELFAELRQRGSSECPAPPPHDFGATHLSRSCMSADWSGRGSLPARGQRPKPVEDIENRARKEQAIASRAVCDDEDSFIDKVSRCGVDACESAADGTAGILDG